MFERIRQMLIKEFIQVFRDPRMRTVIFVIPCVQTLVIGYAVTTDVTDVATVIYDRDNSRESRDLIARFIASGYFRAIEYVDTDLRAASSWTAATPRRFSTSSTVSPTRCVGGGPGGSR